MRSIVVLLGFVLATPAGALDEPVIRQAQVPAHNPLDCYCRAQGKMFAVGEQVCLTTAEGPRIAQCQMVLNVTSWTIKPTPCPET